MVLNSCIRFYFLVCLLINFICNYQCTDASYVTGERLFFLVHKKSCSEKRSALRLLEESGIIGIEEIPEFEKQFNEIVNRNLITADTNFSDSFLSDTNHHRRRLSELTWKERRDHVVAMLDVFATRQIQNFSYKLQSTESLQQTSQASVSTAFLEHLGIDIIDDARVPNSQLFMLAHTLPCLEHKPERDCKKHTNGNLNLPNDYNRVLQWYLSNEVGGIGAEIAWQCYTGQENAPVVAVIDTGCSMHPDLELNMCQCDETCAGYDASGNFNPYAEPSNGQHGTSVSSMVAAVSNNHNGVAGVCWGCRIMCIKAADSDGNIFLSLTLRGINYILEKKIKISNHSYGSYGVFDTEDYAFKLLEEAGHLSVVAAGNENCNIDKIYSNDWDACKEKNVPLGQFSPGGLGLSKMLSVGAATEGGKRAPFSNWGKEKVHLFAPGERIVVLKNTRFNTHHMKEARGTSYAAPLTAGAAALLWGHDPTLTLEELINILLTTVTKNGALIDKSVSGGVLNLGAAMEILKKRKPCSRQSIQDNKKPTRDDTNQFYQSDGCTFTGTSGSFNEVFSTKLFFLLGFTLLLY